MLGKKILTVHEKLLIIKYNRLNFFPETSKSVFFDKKTPVFSADFEKKILGSTNFITKSQI